MRRNSDSARRELERMVLASNLSDASALEQLARVIRRSGGSGSADVQIADAIARVAYWDDVRHLAGLVRERGAVHRLGQLLDRGDVWNRFFGSSKTGFCAECGAQMPCGDEDPESRVCDRCAGLDEETPWMFLSPAVLATGRFSSLAGLYQIKDQCWIWTFRHGAQPVTSGSALFWFLTDVLHEAERPDHLPRHGERVFLNFFQDDVFTHGRREWLADHIVPVGTAGTVILSRSSSGAGAEIFVRADTLVRHSDDSINAHDTTLVESTGFWFPSIEAFRASVRPDTSEVLT